MEGFEGETEKLDNFKVKFCIMFRIVSVPTPFYYIDTSTVYMTTTVEESSGAWYGILCCLIYSKKIIIKCLMSLFLSALLLSLFQSKERKF